MRNKKNEKSPAQEKLFATIERVTFHNPENGFCVLRAKAKGQRDLISIVSNAVSISAGESVECIGQWVNDKRHGLQFQANNLKIIKPNTIEGVEKYLASGMVKGIGSHFAKKLINAFGEQVFEVIENTPERLTELEGIGKKRVKAVIKAWNEQKSIRDLMVFLQSHGIGVARAVKIYKRYGNNAIDLISQNPYILVNDIRGIGFKTADELANKLGIEKDSMVRARAGIRYVLQLLSDSGHCAAMRQELIEQSVVLLEIPIHIIEQAIEQEVLAEEIIQDSINNKDCYYLRYLYQAETKVSAFLARLKSGRLPWGKININKAIPWVEKKTKFQLSKSQASAVKAVLENKLSVITGGPGVGKTTIIKSILTILAEKKLHIALAAPTGRAAKRLAESTQQPAKTIHRLLEFDPQNYAFKHDEQNPLLIDMLILDEASMIDIVLMQHLLKAVPKHASLLLVGDVDQLPSVGPGSVLADIIKSKMISVVHLQEIFRQAGDSDIITNAHLINQGEMPRPNHTEADFFTIYESEEALIQEKLLSLVCQRLPKHYHCDPIMDIQVLTPMHRGGLGSKALNSALQAVLNPGKSKSIKRFANVFCVGDKIIQMTNNYDKDVFNGDIGVIKRVDTKNKTIHIGFENRLVEYAENELDEINLAYAITIHKSQGSEYPIVVIPIVTQHYTLLARNLLYTGVTRGKKLVVLIGQKKAIAMAIHNNKSVKRLTNLAARLQELCCEAEI